MPGPFTPDVGSKILRDLFNVTEEKSPRESLTELHLAAFNGNLTRVKKLLHAGANVNARVAQYGFTPLAGAATENRLNVVKTLIRGGADVNLTFDNGSTALCLAAEVGHLDIINFFLENGANLDVRITASQNSLLHIAALNGHSDVVICLIDKGVDVDTKNIVQAGPLHCAAQLGHSAVVKALIEKGACVNARSNPNGTLENATPLFLAVQYCNLETVEILLKASADVEMKTCAEIAPLHIACEEGYPEIVHALLETDCDVNCKDSFGATPLHYASDSGHVKIVNILLNAKNIEVDAKHLKKFTPLHLATLKGHILVVKSLIEKGANINAKDACGSTPLHISLQHCNDLVSKFLLEKGADVLASNDLNWTPLHEACYSGISSVLLEDLVLNGSKINSLSSDGKSVSFLAAERSHLDILKFLIEIGANINIADNKGISPLHIAAGNGNLEVVEFLVGKVTDINALTVQHETALHFAVESNHLKVAEVLLKNGADVNSQDSSMSNALHTAASRGLNKMSKVLLSSCHQLTLKDKDGRTPLHCAALRLQPAIVKQMIQLGADVEAKMEGDFTPLHLAAKEGRVDVVTALLVGGASFDSKACDQSASSMCRLVLPIDLARSNNQTSVVKLLELVDNLFAATIKSDVNRMKGCIAEGAVANVRKSSGMTPLHYAVSNCNLEAVKVLLENQADLFLMTGNNSSFLHTASSLDRVDILAALLKHSKEHCFVRFNNYVNFQTGKNGATALHNAAKMNNLDAVTLLLKHGAVYNAKNTWSKTPLQLTSNPSIIAQLNSIDKLFEAMESTGNKEAAKFPKMDLGLANARNMDRSTLLYLSISKGHSDNAISLLNNGADYTLVNKEGKSPLYIASAKGNSQVVKALLTIAKNCNPGGLTNLINFPTTVAGTVALHVASNVKVAEILLHYGAVYNIKDAEGKIPSDVTKSKSVKDLLEFVNELFEDAKRADPDNAQKIRALVQLEPERLGAVINARNERGHTLFQVLESRASKKKKVKIGERPR